LLAGDLLSLLSEVLFELEHGKLLLTFGLFFLLELFKLLVLSFQLLLLQDLLAVSHRLSVEIWVSFRPEFFLSLLCLVELQQIPVEHIPVPGSLFEHLFVVVLALDGLLLHLFLQLFFLLLSELAVVNHVKA